MARLGIRLLLTVVLVVYELLMLFSASWVQGFGASREWDVQWDRIVTLVQMAILAAGVLVSVVGTPFALRLAVVLGLVLSVLGLLRFWLDLQTAFAPTWIEIPLNQIPALVVLVGVWLIGRTTSLEQEIKTDMNAEGDDGQIFGG